MLKYFYKTVVNNIRKQQWVFYIYQRICLLWSIDRTNTNNVTFILIGCLHEKSIMMQYSKNHKLPLHLLNLLKAQHGTIATAANRMMEAKHWKNQHPTENKVERLEELLHVCSEGLTQKSNVSVFRTPDLNAIQRSYEGWLKLKHVSLLYSSNLCLILYKISLSEESYYIRHDMSSWNSLFAFFVNAPNRYCRNE